MRNLLIASCAAALLAACNQPTPAAEPAAATAAPSSVRTFPAGSMPIHPVQGSATLLTLTGVDTAQASMTGRITEADAREVCERAPNGEVAQGTMTECISEILGSETEADGGGLHTASADCVAGTLSSSDWGDFRLPQAGTGGEYFNPVWITADGGEASGNGDGGSSASAMFEILCPARAAAWKAS